MIRRCFLWPGSLAATWLLVILCPLAYADVVYSNDFEDPSDPLTEWAGSRITSHSPNSVVPAEDTDVITKWNYGSNNIPY